MRSSICAVDVSSPLICLLIASTRAPAAFCGGGAGRASPTRSAADGRCAPGSIVGGVVLRRRCPHSTGAAHGQGGIAHGSTHHAGFPSLVRQGRRRGRAGRHGDGRACGTRRRGRLRGCLGRGIRRRDYRVGHCGQLLRCGARPLRPGRQGPPRREGLHHPGQHPLRQRNGALRPRRGRRLPVHEGDGRRERHHPRRRSRRLRQGPRQPLRLGVHRPGRQRVRGPQHRARHGRQPRELQRRVPRVRSQLGGGQDACRQEQGR